jgi:hypothetical protein
MSEWSRGGDFAECGFCTTVMGHANGLRLVDYCVMRMLCSVHHLVVFPTGREGEMPRKENTIQCRGRQPIGLAIWTNFGGLIIA